MDITGSLFTSDHRRVKIEGRPPLGADARGTGSCFDATVMPSERAGAHKPLNIPSSQLPRWSPASTQYERASAPGEASCFLRKGTGTGASPRASRSGGGRPASPPPSPPRAGARQPRGNPPNTAFRAAYERGDIPAAVDHRGYKNAIKWKVDPGQLDLHRNLPIFFDGIREKQEPFRFLAVKGVEDLLSAAGAAARVLPVVPQLIVPLKTALATRDPDVVRVALRLLQKLAACGGRGGEALVPYYRQLLPVMAAYVGRTPSLGDGIDYGQQRRECLGELVDETLQALEAHGGPDAFINIKHLVPTFESSACKGGGAR